MMHIAGRKPRGSRSSSLWQGMMMRTRLRKKRLVFHLNRWRWLSAEQRIRKMRGAGRAAAFWRGGLLASAFFDWRQMWYRGLIQNATVHQAARAWHRLSRYSSTRAFSTWAATSIAFTVNVRRMLTAAETWRLSAARWAIDRLWDEREWQRQAKKKEDARVAAEAQAAAARKAAEEERARIAAEEAAARKAAEEERAWREQRAEAARKAEYERRASERAEQLKQVECAWAAAAAAAEEAAHAQYEVEALSLLHTVNAAAAEEVIHRQRLVDSWTAIPPLYFVEKATSSATSSPDSLRSSQRSGRRALSPSLLPVPGASFSLGPQENVYVATPTRRPTARPTPPPPPPSRTKLEQQAQEQDLMKEIWAHTRLFCEETSSSLGQLSNTSTKQVMT
jgi:hypothetical protein